MFIDDSVEILFVEDIKFLMDLNSNIVGRLSNISAYDIAKSYSRCESSN